MSDPVEASVSESQPEPEKPEPEKPENPEPCGWERCGKPQAVGSRFCDEHLLQPVNRSWSVSVVTSNTIYRLTYRTRDDALGAVQGFGALVLERKKTGESFWCRFGDDVGGVLALDPAHVLGIHLTQTDDLRSVQLEHTKLLVKEMKEKTHGDRWRDGGE